ncbi:MAG: hypothetical protein ACYC3W_09855 [Candidatus Nanopelagicales bacterium]
MSKIELKTPTIEWHRSAIGSSISAARVAMTATAALIKDIPATGTFRESISIKNLDAANTVYLGPVGVTAAAGFPLLKGETITLNRNQAAIYGICDATLTASVAYLSEED